MSGIDDVLTAFTELIDERIREARAEWEAERPTVDDGFLNVEQACEFLACGRDRLYQLKSAGRIPHYKDGSRLLFDRAELREYVRNGGAKRP